MSTSPTGRLISTAPSFQQLPLHTPDGDRIRKAFWQGGRQLGKSWQLQQMERHANEMFCMVNKPPRRGMTFDLFFDECRSWLDVENWPVRKLCADIVAGRITLS